MSNYHVTASIVLYKSDKTVLKAINSFLSVSSLKTFLYLIDNSPTNDFEHSNKKLLSDKRIEYIFNNKNLGFGAGHNIAIKKVIDQSEYHLVLNPDVKFNDGVLEDIYEFIKSDNQIGHLIPKVLYPDGSLQYVCKLIPTPLNFIVRLLPEKLFSGYNQRFELRFSGYNKIMDIPYLSGCFMFLRCSALKEVGLFDERFFMYPEDVDLTRRIHKKYRTVFYPHVSIFHEHAKSSHKNIKLFFIHVHNTIKYFNKWGWLFDKERKIINKKTLDQINAV